MDQAQLPRRVGADLIRQAHQRFLAQESLFRYYHPVIGHSVIELLHDGFLQVLFLNQIKAESGFSATARSPAGALGIAQFMPGTGGLTTAQRLNPAVELPAAAKYILQLYREFGNDWGLALAAYNAGETAVLRFGGVPPYPETRDYVSRIVKIFGRSQI